MSWDEFLADEMRAMDKWQAVLVKHDDHYDEILIEMSDGGARSQADLSAALTECKQYLAELYEVTPLRQYTPMTDALKNSLQAAVNELEFEIARGGESGSEPILVDAATAYETAYRLSGQAALELQAKFDGMAKGDLN